jgi:hypothetical protein
MNFQKTILILKFFQEKKCNPFLKLSVNFEVFGCGIDLMMAFPFFIPQNKKDKYL